MKAYLDNNVVSAITKDDLPAESHALDRLLLASEQGTVDLVTSDLTLQEIAACPQAHRSPLERTFRLLERVPIVRWDELLAIKTVMGEYVFVASPTIGNQPMFDALLGLGLGDMDAKHVYVAANTGCNTFLTCDGGILHRAASIQAVCGGLIVERPSALVTRAGW